MIKLLIADDHTLVRQGICKILTLDAEISVVSEAKTGWEVVEKLSGVSCDLVLLDMNMPGPNGVELIKRLKRDYPAVQLLVLSMHSESEIVTRALRAGAAGYVTKDSEPEILLMAIHKVAEGGRYIEPAVAENMIFNEVIHDNQEPHKQFSDREYQVFELLMAGKTIKEISGLLNLSNKTISTYKTRIMNKLDADSDMDILHYAIQHNLSKK